MPMLEVYMYKYNPCFMYTRTHTHTLNTIYYIHTTYQIFTRQAAFFLQKVDPIPLI